MKQEFLNLKIAVDFDGTIVEHKYPEIGKEIIFAIDTLRKLQGLGCQIILWTYRSGIELEEAIEYCRNKGLEFYAVNKNYPEEIFNETISRKINADVFIDDKNLGGIPDWGLIWQMLDPDGSLQKQERADQYFQSSGLSRFLNVFKKK